MKVLVKIVAFVALFALFFVIRFPYDSLVERAVRQAETATGATILYTPGSAGPFGVAVNDLTVRLASGASLQFETARIFPTSSGLKATAYQAENEMYVNFNGTTLDVNLENITVQTGNSMIGTTRVTGDVAFNVRTRDGKGALRLVVPEFGFPLPLPDKSIELGSTFVIRNVGTPEQPRTGVSSELKLVSGDGSASANGTVALEGQPPPNSPLLNGNLRYESPLGRGTIRISGTWDKPSATPISN